MTVAATSTCLGCGHPLVAGARFCMQCGASADDGRLPAPAATDLRARLVRATAGEYQVLGELGRGGMAAVFLAEEIALGRRVAVKVMLPGADTGAASTERFLLEARTAAQLSHPNIVPIYAVRSSAELRYFVMKYIAGRSLDRALTAGGPLPVGVVLSLLAQVAAALEHAHRRGVVHRDIKPANIMLDEDGSAIVADFGIAKVGQGGSLTRTGSTVGTPTYMSPEQCTGKPVTGASDQYSLACVAFELLTGRPPFVHEEVMPVLLAHVSDPPPPVLPLRPDCPLPLAAAVERMLAKEPEDRFASLEEAVQAAEAGAAAGDPAVRAALRALAEPPDPVQIAAPPSIPVSPAPARRTEVLPEGQPASLVIEPNGADLPAGAGLRFRATARDPEGLSLAGCRAEWRSETPDVASVSESGVVTALTEGTAIISARAGAVSATVQVRVARVPVATLEITAPPGHLPVGERRALLARARDQAGALLEGRTVAWRSLDPDLIQVDAQGTVLGLSAGRARIRGECEGAVAEVEVDVRGAEGTLTVLPGPGALAVGQSVRLQAVWLLPAREPRAAEAVEWESSEPEVLRVATDGELVAIRPGSARITARCGAAATEVAYQVTRVDVATVRILPRVAALGVGEEVRLEAQATDRLGSALAGRVITWHSSNPQVVAVSADGVVRGVSPGSARISAGMGAGLAALDLRVTPANVAGIRIEPGSASLKVGESAELQAVLTGSHGRPLRGIAVEWLSSDPGIATVDPTGRVVGVRFGTVRVAATAGGRRATIALEVRSPGLVTRSGPRIRLGG